MLKIIGIITVIAIVFYFSTKNNDLDFLLQETSYTKSVQSGLRDVETTDLHSLAEFGMFTVVELYTDSCSACRKLKKNYDRFLPLRPDVSVRRVNIQSNWRVKETSEKYSVNIRATPHILIFDKNGKLMTQDDGKDKTAYVTLQKWIYGTIKNNS